MNEDTRQEQEEIFSKRVRAGKRTYFFDVKATKNQDYYITITESKRSRFEEGTFTKTKLHLYKEDFNKFTEALMETVLLSTRVNFMRSNRPPGSASNIVMPSSMTAAAAKMALTFSVCVGI